MENTVALVAMRERSPLRWQPNARVSQFAWVRSNPVWGHYPCCRTGTDAAPSAGKWSTVLPTSSMCSSLQTERSPPALGRGVMWSSLWRRLSVGHCEGAAVSRAPWGWRHRRRSWGWRHPSVEHCEGGATVIHHRDRIRTQMGDEA